MLLPFDFALLTVEEARLLIKFIERQTATKSNSKNYEKMTKLGVMEIYRKLEEFTLASDHYNYDLRCLETSRIKMEDY